MKQINAHAPTDEQRACRSTLPLIQGCTYGNCNLHFPQFNTFKEEDFRKSLVKAIADLKVSEGTYWETYAYNAYKNRDELIEAYTKALDEPFLQACERIVGLSDSYIRPELFLSLRGQVVEFIPCCR